MLRIRELRKERALTQAQLAAAAGITIGTVKNLERDGTGTIGTLRKIARGLDIDIRELFEAGVPA